MPPNTQELYFHLLKLIYNRAFIHPKENVFTSACPKKEASREKEPLKKFWANPVSPAALSLTQAIHPLPLQVLKKPATCKYLPAVRFSSTELFLNLSSILEL